MVIAGVGGPVTSPQRFARAYRPMKRDLAQPGRGIALWARWPAPRLPRWWFASK